MEQYEKSLKTLELPAVLDLLAAEAVSTAARDSARALRPSGDRAEVEKRLNETSAAATMMVVKGSPSFSGVKDVRASLQRADMGGMLNTRELLEIAGVLQSARYVRAYGTADRQEKSCIDYLFNSLQANRFLEDKITSSITGEDEIADAASSELASIRRLIRAASARVHDALQKIISSPSYAKALQEPIITMRSERYVVPVKAEHKGAVPGLVHDVSSSGATLFIEPMAAVKANNELRELRAKEKIEIDRILMELSADCAAHREDITCDFDVLVKLDLVFAKAKLSYRLDCVAPALTERDLHLRRARHPLLPKDTAVPIDVALGEDYDTLVITGPNTGGKTVTLKTIGLLSAMAQCGLHIPAADGSCVPVFAEVMADIGDEQSIEQSLSTFSAHMTNIVRILRECDDRSLLLFDELGAGTDPTEGAALAIAIIENARKRGAMIAATTHYTELKVYATTEKGVMNASCEFDVETLRPTYHLLIGIPGKSNAFAISERLGLPQEVIADARSRVGSESASFEATIEKLEQVRQLLERDRLEAAKQLRQAEENAKKSAMLKAELSAPHGARGRGPPPRERGARGAPPPAESGGGEGRCRRGAAEGEKSVRAPRAGGRHGGDPVHGRQGHGHGHLRRPHAHAARGDHERDREGERGVSLTGRKAGAGKNVLRAGGAASQRGRVLGDRPARHGAHGGRRRHAAIHRQRRHGEARKGHDHPRQGHRRAARGGAAGAEKEQGGQVVPSRPLRRGRNRCNSCGTEIKSKIYVGKNAVQLYEKAKTG